jgi:hypothetical protein
MLPHVFVLVYDQVFGTTFHVDKKYVPIKALGKGKSRDVLRPCTVVFFRVHSLCTSTPRTGAHGVVCAAKNRETNTKVAIKKISPMCATAADGKHSLREVCVEGGGLGHTPSDLRDSPPTHPYQPPPIRAPLDPYHASPGTAPEYHQPEGSECERA